MRQKMKHVAKRIFAFYADGFREMKLGKILWAIIAIKLFIMFAILKVFFFPDTASLQSKKMHMDEKEYIAQELIERMNTGGNN